MNRRQPAVAALGALLVVSSACDRAPCQDPEVAPTPMQSPAEPRTLDGGLVVHDITLGAGPEAQANSIVEIRFVAMLANGTVWDSTDQRQRTLSFALDEPGLIKGLQQGILGMRQGGARRLEIPWTLAYGELGRDPVPPKTDLLYEIELVGVNSPASQDDPEPRQ